MVFDYDVILVGGTGFIGHSLAEALVRDHQRTLSIGRGPKPDHPGEVLLLDIAHAELVANQFPSGRTVYILIGQNSATFDPDQEIRSLKNLIATLNKRLPQQVFYLSSGLVYGETNRPAVEEDECLPLDPYSVFKLNAEKLLMREIDSRIALGILRLANVYGGEKNRGLVGLVVNSLAQVDGVPIVVNGDGTQRRDYMFIDDVVRALVTVQKQLAHGREIINIATGKSYSIIELLRELNQFSLKQIPFTVNGVKIREVTASQMSSVKLTTRFRYVPQYSLSSGLYETLKRRGVLSGALRGIRTLLVGGEGFIGRNIADALAKSTECFSVGKTESIFRARSDTFIQADPYCQSLPNSYNVIVHLIDHKVPIGRFVEAEERLATNIGLCSKNWLILFSSAVVYSNPDSVYGQRKRLLEQFYTRFCSERNIPLTIFRPFNFFGPYQMPFRQGSLVANLICNHLRGRQTEINDMKARRDFMCAVDIPKFIEYAVSHQLQGTYDIGSSKLVSLQDLISYLEKSALARPLMIIDKKGKDGLPSPPAEAGLFTSLPKVGLESGLRITADFYRNKQDILQRYVD